MSRRRTVYAAVGIAAVGLCFGCSNADTSAPTQTAEHFVTRVQDGDGVAACALLSEQARNSAQGMSGSSCAALIVDLREHGTDIHRTQVWGDTAQVRIGTDVLFLRRYSSGWQVTAAGCAPRPRRPYDCQVQA